MEELSSTTSSEQEAMMELPPGFRFHPTDEEIISHYLRHKVLDPSFSAAAVADADFNKCEPWDLPSKSTILVSLSLSLSLCMYVCINSLYV